MLNIIVKPGGVDEGRGEGNLAVRNIPRGTYPLFWGTPNLCK